MRALFPKLLTCLCLLGVSGFVRADHLDGEQARQAAVSFFNNSTDRGLRRVKAQQLQLLPSKHRSGCYIFNREDGGTIFVADDDAIGYTVLGYTDGGSINLDSIPVGLQDWLDQIGVLMDAVHEGKINQRHKLQTRAGTVEVSPLIRTEWSQRTPYNNLTPTINGQHCITGCEATATAQVLNYWKWPERSYGTGSYFLESENFEVEHPVTINTQYDWQHMLNSYPEGSYTQQEANAVAELNRDCGYAMKMTYGLNYSGDGLYVDLLSKVFDYHFMGYLNHDDYAEDVWHSFIKSDLLNGRPILYGGGGLRPTGHIYIVDGCTSNNYLHVNWGWGGYSDGWYLATDMLSFNNDQFMAYAFEPNSSFNTFNYTLEDSVLTITGKGTMPDRYAMETAPWRDCCQEIKKIVIGEGITSVVDNFGDYWTDDTSYYFGNLKEVSLPEGLTFLGMSSFVRTSMEEVELPSSLMLLNSAFWECSKLKTLRLGPNVIDFISDGLNSKTSVEIDEANPFLMIRDNVLYTKDGTWLKSVFGTSRNLVIPEEVKRVTGDAISNQYLVISKPLQAPRITNSYNSYYNPGVLIVPKDATGYANWQRNLYPYHKMLYCSDIDMAKINLDWSLTDGILSLKGLTAIDDMDNMPYSSVRNDIRKIEIGEGIVSLSWTAFHDCPYATEITLPSTLRNVCRKSFPYLVNTITCAATKAPVLEDESLYILNYIGTLRVPVGSTGYDAWLRVLPSGWQIEYYTPAPQVVYKLPGDDAEHGACSLDAWEDLLNDYPNTVGVFKGDFELLPYLTYNIALAGAETETGYLCLEFKMTDLTSGFKTPEKAPQTGFNPIVSFNVMKGNYKRQLSKGNNSICLPFEVIEDDLPQYCTIYTYSHYDNENEDAIFTEEWMAQAAQPCYIVSEYDRIWTKTLDGSVIRSEQPSDTGDFCGTYVSTSKFKDRGYAPRNSDNIFAPLADQLHPFRACFILDSPANVRMQLVDGKETGIATVQTQHADAIYRLDGVRVSGNRQRGIYIVNGRKVIK